MKILVVCTEEYLTLRLLKCLAPLKGRVHILSTQPSPILQASRHCAHYHLADRTELADGREIEEYCTRHGIDVILPCGIGSVFLMASLRDRIHAAKVLPTAPLELLQLLDNKWRLALLLEEIGLPYPKSQLLKRIEDGLALAMEFPVVVKPLDLDAGRGVTRCETQEEVNAHLNRCSDSLPLLVQEYIPGVDVGLGLLAQAGETLAWTIQRQRSDGSGIAFIEDDRVLEIGRKIMAHCRFDGIAHFDLRLDSRDGSVKVLECNPRFWASVPFSMLAGVNFGGLGISLALGHALPKTNYHPVEITFPSKVLSGALRGQFLRQPLSSASHQALRFTLSDPAPFLVLGAIVLQSKVNRLFSHDTCATRLEARLMNSGVY